MESSHDARLASQDNIFVQRMTSPKILVFEKTHLRFIQISNMTLLCSPKMCTCIYFNMLLTIHKCLKYSNL